MSNIDELSYDDLSKLTKANLLALIKGDKTRPILIRVSSIWSKRKLLADYTKAKSEGVRLNFTLRDHLPDSDTYRTARNKARQLNENERNADTTANKPIMVSYSARPNGDIITFHKIGQKWEKVDSRKNN